MIITSLPKVDLVGVGLNAIDTLIALHRSSQDGEIREQFRILRPRGGPKPLRAFSFLEVEGETEPGDTIDLLKLGDGERQ